MINLTKTTNNTTTNNQKTTMLDYISTYVSIIDTLLNIAQTKLLTQYEFQDQFGTLFKNTLKQLHYYDSDLAESLQDLVKVTLEDNFLHVQQNESKC